ncbi:hypothetical protein MOQ_000422 [Trypanosoma cruzi marinkellei]|uniref:Uncharacterized protein n=1 Tax=Trypanosoma cruzi marinkellei TaxID=85056 RepID=K2NNG7_TRYCR|nr:hypothetical protein MOQ_000422 [Trypanosoma cruzi marinkellei]
MKGAGEQSFFSHFLHASGYGGAMDDVFLLLLTATTRLTCDLRDLVFKAGISPARREACDKLFEDLKDVINEVAAVPEGRVVGATGELKTLHVFRYGSFAIDTALYDSAVDMTLIRQVHPSTDYFLRRNVGNNNAQGLTQIEGLLRASIANTEASILLPYPACYSLALPLMQEQDLLISIKDVFVGRLGVKIKQHLTFCSDNAHTLCLHSLANDIDVNVTVDRTEAVEASAGLQQLLKASKSALPVIIFMKVVLKQFNVQSSQLTPYVLTLMVVAFSKFCSHMFPSFGFNYYPHPRETVEPGYLLFSFLSFFSPLPRGQFDPTQMILVPIHPHGVVYETNEGDHLSQLDKNVGGIYWRVMEPTKRGDNAAASCVLIDKCRDLFEHILVVLLQHYTGVVITCPVFVDDAHAQIVDAEEVSKTEEIDIDNHLISLLLRDWWFKKQGGSV